MGRDLVIDGVGPHQLPNQFTSAAGSTDAANIQPLAQLFLDLLQTGADHLDGPPLGTQVNLVQQPAFAVDHHQVGRDRADIDAEIGLDLIPPTLPSEMGASANRSRNSTTFSIASGSLKAKVCLPWACCSSW